MNKMLDKNSEIKSLLDLKNDKFLNSDEIDKIKNYIIDTEIINNYYFEKDSIKDKTYHLKDDYKNLSHSFNSDNESYENESFRIYYSNKGLDIEVSNLGRVKINGKIAEQVERYKNDKSFDKKVGYLQLNKNNTEDIKNAINKIEEQYVYGMVAKIWLGRPKGKNWEVHHITNNGYDNRVENLIWVKKEAHKKIHDFK